MIVGRAVYEKTALEKAVAMKMCGWKGVECTRTLGGQWQVTATHRGARFHECRYWLNERNHTTEALRQLLTGGAL